MLTKGLFVLAMLHVCGLRAGAAELSGKIFEDGGEPLSGAKIKLVLRGDSAFSNSDGSFRLVFSSTGLNLLPSMGETKAPYLRTGDLFVNVAHGSGEIRMEVFNLSGQRISSLSRSISRTGLHRIPLLQAMKALRGIGWLRVTVGNRVDWLRICDLTVAVALAGRSKSVNQPAGKTAAFADTILVEKPGFYTHTDVLYSALGEVRGFTLFKDSKYGLDSAEVKAWQEHQKRPTFKIRISRVGIFFPEGVSQVGIRTADGQVVSNWKTDPCNPGPLPRSMTFTYTWDGVQYRDSVDLSHFWSLDSSFSYSSDSLSQYVAGYSLSWIWPNGFTVLPDRNWMHISATRGWHGDDWFSYPIFSTSPPRPYIEGGYARYGVFKPGSDSVSIKTMPSSQFSFQAEFTLANRLGHDFRIELAHQTLPTPWKLSFLNSWPLAGIKTGQTLRLERNSNALIENVTLEYGFPELGSWLPLDEQWKGATKEWVLPFLLRDTLPIQFRMTENRFRQCQTQVASPVFHVLPDEADTALSAFEPNENAGEAALVPMGEWISAAFDFRRPPKDDDDLDYYKFRAVRGDSVRFTIRNSTAGELNLAPVFDPRADGFGVNHFDQGAMTYGIPQTGDCVFMIYPQDQLGHYQFRIDKAN